MSEKVMLVGWMVICGSSLLCLDRLLYSHHLTVRNQLERDCANPGIIKLYDKWLNSPWYYRIVHDPYDNNRVTDTTKKIIESPVKAAKYILKKIEKD